MKIALLCATWMLPCPQIQLVVLTWLTWNTFWASRRGQTLNPGICATTQAPSLGEESKR
jgi:hypothetical protein